MTARLVAVFGGSGFLGRRIVSRLLDDGATVRIAVRHPEFVPSGGGMADTGRLTVVHADVRDENSVASAVAGCNIVVNCVSAYVETADVAYDDVHVQGARILAESSACAGVSRLVLISGIGANSDSPSKYIRARGTGEHTTLEAFPSASVLRPSVMFGPDDQFLNAFADIARKSPVFPLIGGGRTRIQPAFVDDVARAVERALDAPAAPGVIYELGGPQVFTLRELVEIVLERTDRRPILASVPFPIARALATLFEVLPQPPLTRAQVELLELDNVVGEGMPGFSDFGIAPSSVAEILPYYSGALTGSVPTG